MFIRKFTTFLLLSIFFLPSCKELKEVRSENQKLKKEVDELKFNASTQKKKQDNQINRLKFERDSLLEIVKTLKNSTTDGYLATIDSLQKEIVHHQQLLADSQQKKSKISEQNRQMQQRLRSLFAVSGNESQQVEWQGSTYDCYLVDVKKCEVQFFWQDPATRQPLQSLRNLDKMLTSQGKNTLVFATNAGMYTPASAPQGLFIQHGKVLVPVDRKKEMEGNFYMQPNGIFLLDTAGVPKIITTDQYLDAMAGQIRFATQSGPMVVVEGVINPKFKIGSEHLNIRSGVGILPDGRVVFLISNQRVNFYDFATVFKEKFKCQWALYLDGAISEMYLPELGRFQDGGHFGPIIGILKK